MPDTAAGVPPSFPVVRSAGSRPRPLPVIAIVAAVLGLATACGTVVSPSATSRAAAPAPASAPAAAAAADAVAPAPCASGNCWVAVSVATLWVKPWYPRPVDAPALSNPAHPLTWVHTMTVAQKRWLVGKLETQALYGTKVIVTGHWRNWSHVNVPSQPTNRDPRRGYPGWVPTRQLTRTAPAPGKTAAVIRSRTAWLWSGWKASGVAGRKVLLVSYNTSLPVAQVTARYIRVKLIGGRIVALRRSDAYVHTAGVSWGATRARVVAQARKFLGLAYLWAGTSGFGYDCSGFTYSVYRAYGVTLSRDADQQAVHGKPVARSALRPGDLVFFRGRVGGPISHVGMYVGGGNMIDAPHTGAAVRIEPVVFNSRYAGARRYLSS